MLHEIDEVRVYCGPAALMAVTGERLPVVRASINKAKGRKENAGVCITALHEMLEAIETLGYKHYCQNSEFPAHVKTLGKIAKDEHWCLPDRTYIVYVTGHYVAVENGLVFDNFTRFGSPVEEHWCFNKKVKALVWVHK